MYSITYEFQDKLRQVEVHVVTTIAGNRPRSPVSGWQQRLPEARVVQVLCLLGCHHQRPAAVDEKFGTNTVVDDDYC